MSCGLGAAQRADKFLAISTTTTITEAAATLGVSASVLAQQTRRLAAGDGGDLIIPATPARPLQLTELGRQLRQAIFDGGLPEPSA